MAPIFSFLALGLFAIDGVFSHPGHSVNQEAAERAVFMKRGPRSVRTCASSFDRRGQLATALSRRRKMAAKARLERDLLGRPLVTRDYAAYNFSHASDLDVGLGSDETLLFADNSSCILQPEVTQGPYYVNGELIRTDIHEDQAGVPLYLDIQLVDTSTCKPVPAVFMDIWHCNATGVYSGVVASGNGDSSDSTNIDNTFLRGIQQTDANGVAQFLTIVPGHYTGRAPHIHVLTHNTNTTVVRTNGTLLPSGSNSSSTHASHVGQLFFDQTLISAIDQISPYSDNTQSLTTNDEDSILASEAADMDPFIEYVQLSDDLSDGLMAWITLGIDPTADSEITPAAVYYQTGGVANANSGMGGGGGGPGGSPPNGTSSAGNGTSGASGPAGPSGSAGSRPSGSAGAGPSGGAASFSRIASSGSVGAATAGATTVPSGGSGSSAAAQTSVSYVA